MRLKPSHSIKMASSITNIDDVASGQDLLLGFMHFVPKKAKDMILTTSFTKGQAFRSWCLDFFAVNLGKVRYNNLISSHPTKLAPAYLSTGQVSCLVGMIKSILHVLDFNSDNSEGSANYDPTREVFMMGLVPAWQSTSTC